ncbi:Peptidyl-prolyl cis-trans isomerase cyp15 [Saitoella coloradoensis]
MELVTEVISQLRHTESGVGGSSRRRDIDDELYVKMSSINAVAPETVSSKRPYEEDEKPAASSANGAHTIENEDIDDDMGPMPLMPNEAVPKKKRKVLPHERIYLSNLPSSDKYTKSFMHRDNLSFVTLTPYYNFVITTSVDGYVKFWKKQAVGIEFVKQYRAHVDAVVAVGVSAGGELFASCGANGSLKIFDVINFDMIGVLQLPYKARALAWVHARGQAQALLAVSDADSSAIHIYDPRSDDPATPLHTISSLHKKSVNVIAYNYVHDCVVSSDIGGMIEYWRPRGDWSKPSDGSVYDLKSSTDLYEFKKAKSVPTCIAFSPDGTHFATISLPDRQVRVFDFKTGKMVKKYDESLQAATEMQRAGTALSKLEDTEFGRRVAVEKEIERTPEVSSGMNVVWDESSHFIAYGSILGIKVVNTHTNRCVRLLGRDEPMRFTNLSLYQGAPQKKGTVTLAMAASDNPLLAEKSERDPTLFCTGFKKGRFYMFTQDEGSTGDRDVFNEKPTREDMSASTGTETSTVSGTVATLHTTLGDIQIRLFPEAAPKAVENFITHAKNGYYDNTIFHRIIKKFMIQCGDPLGDGTGGASIWGREFEDEFSPDLKHDRPFTVSMANAGPNTNGSQFFITTAKTPWLDNKHTIFGRAVVGLDVVNAIENLRTDKFDKPEDPPKILNITVK